MEKIDNSKTLFEDINIIEYVAGTLSAQAKANFEKALSEDDALQKAVASEQAFRASVAQAKPDAILSADNIDGLFKLIDEDDKRATEKENDSSSNVVKVNFGNRMAAGSAIAASLLVAVFFSVNFSNNDLLEPDFQALSNSEQQSTVNLNELSQQNRLVKFTLVEPLSSSVVDSLLAEYQLVSLNKSINSTSVVAQSNQAIDAKSLTALQADERIESIELLKFNENKK